MVIRRIEITGIRNLDRTSLNNLSKINVFFGENGAGKTSVLESIHLLSSAKSFRSHKFKPIINHELDGCVIFGEVYIPGAGYQPIGIERHKSPTLPGSIRVSGKELKSIASLAECLPLQVISADTFKLLEGSPSTRRKFLDWGVFHVEHDFLATWKGAQRCLKQRNTLLRHVRIDDDQMKVWTDEFGRLGEQLHQYREAYIQQFVPVFEQVLAQLTPLPGLTLSYFRGWDKESSLVDALDSNASRDIAQGYTTTGPHRSDLKLRYQSSIASEVLSRGQQKLVVCALRVAQGYLLSMLADRPCVYLIDDLPAELDKKHRKALCSLLEQIPSQVFMTCVDPTDLDNCWSLENKPQMFHVEHGVIKAG